MATRLSTDSRGLRPQPIQTSQARPRASSRASRREGNSATNPTSGQFQFSDVSYEDTSRKPNASDSSGGGHQRFVLTDPLAFRYLEGDPMTTVLERRQELQGYECYVVEQWTTSRSHPTFTITTYTGDPSHTVVVGVLSVPTDEKIWSPRLRVYFKALNQYHARRRETPLGILMVTNLSGFPSSLTVIPVPDGDLRKHRSDFFVNENLKRLNCSGRVGLTLVPPTGATGAKFHQLYRTSDKNEIYHSVIELVKLCQSALMLFDKLEIDYADGLLCDVTERAVNDWWVEIGSEKYNIEPHDGILGPTTVAGLLGLLMGARNRLHAVNAPVGKDPFDVEAMKKGISAFQKQQRLTRSRRLDRRTLDQLHRTTQKAANSDGYWAVPKAVKSTVAELSGKGGEMVMDAVGRRDRAGIAEIETCDMERFVQLVYGEKAKWLWLGKPLKHKSAKDEVGASLRSRNDSHEMLGKNMQFREGEHGGFAWTARKSMADGAGMGRHQREANDDIGTPTDQSEDENERFKVLKRSSGFKEGKAGLGSRFKGAVGLSSHQKTASKDLSPRSPRTPTSPRSPRVSTEAKQSQERRPTLSRSHSSPISNASSPRSPIQDYRFGPSLTASIPEHDSAPAPAYASSYREAPRQDSQEASYPPSYMSTDRANANGSADDAEVAATDQDANISDTQSDAATGTNIPSIAGSIYEGVNLNEVLPQTPGIGDHQQIDPLLRRTLSDTQFVLTESRSRASSDDAYPRHLSFSLAEDSVLTWDELVDRERDPYRDDAKAATAHEEYFANETRDLQSMITSLSSSTARFTQSQIQTLESLTDKLSQDQETMESMYKPLEDRLRGLQTQSEEIVHNESDRLQERSKEIETLAAKLEYEINGLRGRLEDVEAGVGDFGKGVGRVEERVGELERDGKRAEERGWQCVVC